MKTAYLDKIRQQNPLIHNITNLVAANLSANGLLAIGASPLMSANLAEMRELAALSNALVINIGTLNGSDREAMLLAGKAANQQGIPVVLDPVGVGATNYRRETVKALLKEVQFALIRGNAGELASIAEVAWQAKGVDAGSGSGDLVQIAQKVAQQYACTVLISGATDVISDGKRLALVANGTPLFPKITASGCLLSAVCAAFLAVAQEDAFGAVLEACSAYTVAGELAAAGLSSEYGRFQSRLLDELGGMTSAKVAQCANIQQEVIL